MHQAHARIERDGAGQIVEFPAGSGVCAFGKVDEEGPVSGSFVQAADDVLGVAHGVGPAIFCGNVNREFAVENFGKIAVLLGYGCDASQQIANPSPPETEFAGNLLEFPDRRFVRAIDIFGPFAPTGIWTPAELRVQGKIQVIVGVDETGENQMTGEIDLGSVDGTDLRREKALDAIAAQVNREELGDLRRTRDAGAAEHQLARRGVS